MKLTEQRKLLKAICNNVRDDLLKRSDKWPENWDGHELRELVAFAHEHERTTLMRESRRRRLDARNEIIVNNLY